MENEVFPGRYLHYNDWEEVYGVSWDDDEGPCEVRDCREWRAERPPDCEEEDRRALANLLGKLGCWMGFIVEIPRWLNCLRSIYMSRKDLRYYTASLGNYGVKSSRYLKAANRAQLALSNKAISSIS
jgi:hypothetical protein